MSQLDEMPHLLSQHLNNIREASIQNIFDPKHIQSCSRFYLNTFLIIGYHVHNLKNRKIVILDPFFDDFGALPMALITRLHLQGNGGLPGLIVQN